MSRLSVIVITVVMGLAVPAGANDLSDMVGDWRTVRHGAEVKIRDCGNGSPCGFLVSVDTDVSGGSVHDERNSNRALRDRPLDGLPILWGYSSMNSGWKQGRLYNPETGQTFRSSLDLISSDRLQVKGCLGPFCRQQTWTRIRRSETAQSEGSTHE